MKPLVFSALVMTALILPICHAWGDPSVVADAFAGRARNALLEFCRHPSEEAGLKDWRFLREEVRGSERGAALRVRDYAATDGAIARLITHPASGKPKRSVLDFYEAVGGGARARISVAVDERCEVTDGRRIEYDTSGRPMALEYLGADLERVVRRELLNPPLPAGQDPGGVMVAVVDSGVNYLLPTIRAALARDTAGRSLGYDYAELDEFPFDGDPYPSPFAMRRHGTGVAQVLLSEFANIRLVPYRYPGTHPDRFAALVDDASRKGVRIVNLSLGGGDERRWRPFREAAQRHPEMLFVVAAGNDGQDLDKKATYPPSYALQNMLVVAALDDRYELLPATNFGATSVDIAVKAYKLKSIDFTGRTVFASGSSVAAPRVAAIAASLLAANPSWNAEKIRREIISRAKPGSPHLKYGVIEEPLVAPHQQPVQPRPSTTSSTNLLPK